MWLSLLFLILVVFGGKNASTWGFSTTNGKVPPYRSCSTTTTTPTAISTAQVRTRCWNSPRRNASLGDDDTPLPFTPLARLPSLPSPSPHPQQRRHAPKSRLSLLNTSKNPIAHRTTNGAPSENWQSHTSRRRILLILKSTANWASLLCLFDCTILPFLSILLPLVGWINTGSTTVFADGSLGSSFQHFLCHGVHTLALYFVVPTGTATVIWNYWTGHRNRWVAAMGIAGIFLVGWTNLPESLNSSSLLLQQQQHHNHSLLSHDGSTVYQLLHLMGSLLLLGSNLVAQQVLGCDCGIPFCRPVRKNTWKKKKNPLLVVPLASTRSGTTPPPTTTAMSLQTQMIHHKQRQQRLQLTTTRLTVMEDV